MHPWHEFKKSLRGLAAITKAPIIAELWGDLQLNPSPFLSVYIRPDQDRLRLNPSDDLLSGRFAFDVHLDPVRSSLCLKPTLRVRSEKSLNPISTDLARAVLEAGVEGALSSYRRAFDARIYEALQHNTLRNTVLHRALASGIRVSHAFAHCLVLRACPQEGFADVLFDSDSDVVTLEKPGRMPISGALGRSVATGNAASGVLTGSGKAGADKLVQFVSAPIPASVEGLGKYGEERFARATLVLIDPVPFPGDNIRPRALTFLDYAMAFEAAEVLKRVLADFYMQQTLSHNYEMAFHGTGRTVDGITAAFAYLMEVLYGFNPDSKEVSEPFFDVVPRDPSRSTNAMKRMIESNYANAMMLGNQVGRFELSKPNMYRYTIERIDKPLAECFAPVLAMLPHYESYYGAPRTHLNRLDVVSEYPEPIRADRNALQIVISNVIENAVKYRKRGAPASIRLNWVNEPNVVRFSIIDNGLGIKPGEEEAIFNPYFRSASVKPFNIFGTGLGLAAARQLIRGMEGSIEAQARGGEGATIIVTLPRASRAR